MVGKYAQIAYEGYCESTDGKSLISGEKLPAFDLLRDEIREAWEAAAQAVIEAVSADGDIG
jgi:hypothetical protein